MSLSPWLTGARRPARLHGALLVAGTALTLTGCGTTAEPEATAPPVTAPVGFACPVTAAQVGQAIRSDLQLLRTRDKVCAYGVERPDGRADLTEPIARIAERSTPLAERRAAALRDRPDRFVGRPDLGVGAFALVQPLKQGRQRATLEFAEDDGTLIVIVDVPASAHAADEAMDRAEGLFDLLISRQ